MEGSMERVAKHCGKELDTYQRCILANQSNPSTCDPYKASLSQCAASAVPLMSRIKAQCKPAILQFDACINEANRRGMSDEQTNELCGGKLRELWVCTERAQRELKGEEPSGGQ